MPDNDPFSDQILVSLRGKIQELVDTWLQTYRQAVGMSSPLLRNLNDIPIIKQRTAQSARYPHTTAVKNARDSRSAPAHRRAPSAPPPNIRENDVI